MCSILWFPSSPHNSCKASHSCHSLVAIDLTAIKLNAESTQNSHNTENAEKNVDDIEMGKSTDTLQLTFVGH